jgi:sugar transferase EpsL
MKSFKLQLGAKRCLDILLGSLGLILTSPLLVAAALAVRIKLGSPVFFRQVRPGLHGLPFSVMKLRTMRDTIGADGKPLPDDQRLTPLGKLLRSSSLDELPQLFNILRGDISVVGPRPLLMQYLPRYTPEQARRHDVIPGLTGWAQINGRNAICWEDKFALDVWYVDHWSFWLDLKIIALTFLRVFQRSGISSSNHATMPEFMGSDSAHEAIQSAANSQ